MKNAPEPRTLFDRWFDALIFGGGGLLFLWVSRNDASSYGILGWVLGGAGLVAAYGSWRDTRWRRWAALASYLALFAFVASMIGLRGGSAIRWIGLACIGYGIWQELSGWIRERRFQRDLKEQSENEREPMTSLVLLQRSLSYMDRRTLAELCSEAWGRDYANTEEDSPHFVVGEEGPFIIKGEDAMFMVHRVDNTYWEDMDELLDEVRELRMFHLLQGHTAWMAVDLLSPTKPEGRTRESYYPEIAKLLAELANEETLAVVWPERQLFAPWTDDVEAKLQAGNPEAVWEESEFAPVVRVSSDDPRMVAAREEARRRWPKFVEAFKARKPDDPPWMAKVGITRDENTEYIWIEVIGIEPEYVHGKLANQPVALGDLKEGDQVEAPLTELNDWMFRKDGELVGGFTVAVVNEIQREAREGRKARPAG